MPSGVCVKGIDLIVQPSAAAAGVSPSMYPPQTAVEHRKKTIVFPVGGFLDNGVVMAMLVGTASAFVTIAWAAAACVLPEPEPEDDADADADPDALLLLLLLLPQPAARATTAAPTAIATDRRRVLLKRLTTGPPLLIDKAPITLQLISVRSDGANLPNI